MNNNDEFINRYRDPSTKHFTISNRIENTQETIKSKLNDLVSLGIITIVGSTKVRKGNATTPLYFYNGSGVLLALIIESFDPNKRDMANDKIYRLTELALAQPRSAYNIFQAALYKKYNERGIFGSFVVDILREKLCIWPDEGHT